MSLHRRTFLQLGTGLCTAAFFPQTPIFAEDTTPELDWKPVRLALGAEKPFRAVHVSDSHLCLADDRENDRKRTLAQNRFRYFRHGEEFLDAAITYARKTDALFLHTGDLIDFVSESNLEAVTRKFENLNAFVSAGNHEFSQYVGEAREDDAYKAQSFARVQRAFPNDLTFCSRVIHGINFIALDDVYYNVTAAQQELFQHEVNKGLPIVMLCHIPLYTPALFDFMLRDRKERQAYLLGAPGPTPHADAPTAAFLDYLRNQKLLKAIFCGHLHVAWSGPFSETATQYVAGGNFQKTGYEIEFT